jgi:hypothetical protein
MKKRSSSAMVRKAGQRFEQEQAGLRDHQLS